MWVDFIFMAAFDKCAEGDSRRNARQFEVVREATTRLHDISKKLDIPHMFARFVKN